MATMEDQVTNMICMRLKAHAENARDVSIDIADHVRDFMRWTAENSYPSLKGTTPIPKWYVYPLAAKDEECLLGIDGLYDYWFKIVKHCEI